MGFLLDNGVVRDCSHRCCIVSWAYVVVKFSDQFLKLPDQVQQLLKYLNDLSPLIESWHVLDPSCFSCQVLVTICYV